MSTLLFLLTWSNLEIGIKYHFFFFYSFFRLWWSSTVSYYLLLKIMKRLSELWSETTKESLIKKARKIKTSYIRRFHNWWDAWFFPFYVTKPNILEKLRYLEEVYIRTWLFDFFYIRQYLNIIRNLLLWSYFYYFVVKPSKFLIKFVEILKYGVVILDFLRDMISFYINRFWRFLDRSERLSVKKLIKKRGRKIKKKDTRVFCFLYMIRIILKISLLIILKNELTKLFKIIIFVLPYILITYWSLSYLLDTSMLCLECVLDILVRLRTLFNEIYILLSVYVQIRNYTGWFNRSRSNKEFWAEWELNRPGIEELPW